jgi:hypothetical protein
MFQPLEPLAKPLELDVFLVEPELSHSDGVDPAPVCRIHVVRTAKFRQYSDCLVWKTSQTQRDKFSKKNSDERNASNLSPSFME